MSPSLAVILPVTFGTVILVVVVFSIIVACTTPVERVYIRRARPKPDPEKNAGEAGPPPHEATPDDAAGEEPVANDPDLRGDEPAEGGDEGDGGGGGEAGGDEGGGDGEEGGDGASPNEEADH